ncbi:hypothetical protein [Nonomuraea sp. NPDC005650]|uniref:hypothetical protein n=1 Tax=Nonomuraea sp. NPDC005650 TaxID=3157045 RepID=UPI0033AE75E8
MRRLVVRLLAAAIVGALVGLATFQLTKVEGRWLFVVTGMVAGVAAVIAIQLYNKAARLTEVKVKVPQVSELTFVVNNESRHVAWKLFVETITRVSTQPLDEDEGLVREAMTSLYGLFSTTRDTLKASRPSSPVPGSQSVEHLAITMLNRELRPFLSKWHPRLREFEQGAPESPESAWEGNMECRTDLRQVQARIREYALGYAKLAGVREPEEMIKAPSEG